MLIGRGADDQIKNNNDKTPAALANNDATKGAIKEAVEAKAAAEAAEAMPNIEEKGARSGLLPEVAEEEDELLVIEPGHDPGQPLTAFHLKEQNKTKDQGR